MTEEERERACLWLCRLGVDPSMTPEDALFEYDPTHGEWRIEQFRRDFPLTPDGEGIQRIILRRRAPEWSVPAAGWSLLDLARDLVYLPYGLEHRRAEW